MCTGWRSEHFSKIQAQIKDFHALAWAKSSHMNLQIFVVFVATWGFALAGQNAQAASSLSADPAFNPPTFAAANPPARVLLLPDGKFVAYFNVDTVLDVPSAGSVALANAGAITRYLSDGTFDASFHFPSDYDQVFAAAALPDGRLIVAASPPPLPYGYGPGLSGVSNVILRLNTDGSIDSSFGPAQTSGDAFDQWVRVITIQPDGKILLGGLFTKLNGAPRQGIVRLNSDGTLDTGFAVITMTGSNFFSSLPGIWANLFVQPDGKIIIGGDFDQVSDGSNSVFCPGVARLNTNGTVDTSFQPSGFDRGFTAVRGIVIQSNGKIVIGGNFAATFPPHDFSDTLPLIRLNADGSADPAYACFDFVFPKVPFMKSLVLQADDKVVAVGNTVYRFNAVDGTLDNTFRQPVLQGLPAFPHANMRGVPQAFSANLQPDGKILIGGVFDGVDNAANRFGIARINSDGTLDSLATLHNTGLRSQINGFSRGRDGSTLVTVDGGSLSDFPVNLTRLLPDGSLDSSFDPFPSYDSNGSLTPSFSAIGLCPLPNGNIFVFGDKTFEDPYGDIFATATYGRLFPNASEDTSFSYDMNSGLFNNTFAQPDGKVLISSDNPQSTVLGQQLQRIDTNGLLDPTFKLDVRIVNDMVIRNVQPPSPPAPHSPPPTHPTVLHPLSKISVGCRVLTVLGNGKILFSYLAADNTYKLVRLNSNGSLDSTFVTGVVAATGTFSIYEFVSDPQDPTAFPVVPTLINGDVPVVAPAIADAKELAGGAIIVVGSFTTYNGQAAPGIVELKSNGSIVPKPTFNAGAGVQWTQTPVTATERPGIEKVEVQSSGNFLILGTFEAFNGKPAPGIASLFPTGAVDASFVAPVVRRKYGGGATYFAKQSDGSYLLSGAYTRPGDFQTPSFIRLVK